MNPFFQTMLFSTCIVCMLATPSHADLRSDLLSALAEFRKGHASTRFPDDMRSLDATLATAEMYFQIGDTKNADRFYQLAAQKTDLLRQLLVKQAAQPAVEPAKPSNDQTSSAKQAPAVASPTPAPVQAAPDQTAQPAAAPPSVPAGPISADSAPKSSEETVADTETFISGRLVGTVGTYTVAKGETLRLVAAKLGVNRYQLATANRLKSGDPLKAGQVLKYNNQRIVPDKRLRDGIVINIPDRMLYLYENGTLQFSTAVALGTPTKTEQFVWQTPTGRFKIVNKAKDPVWTVPPSIQEEMRLEGKEVITSVPAGKDNPLGKYAMKTSLPGILIHSTTKPWSIYTYASHGCIRVFPERMEELFKLVKTNTPGEIIYKPVKLAETDDGKILLEVHGDIYNKTKGLAAEARTLIRTKKLEDRVNWEKVKRVLSRKSGVAEDISFSPHESQQTADNSNTQSPS